MFAITYLYCNAQPVGKMYSQEYDNCVVLCQRGDV